MKQSFGKRFIYIWSAFLINWGVEIAVEIAAGFFFTAVYAREHYQEMIAVYNDSAGKMDMAKEIASISTQYATVLKGITALIVIPLMIYLYQKDRKEEEQTKLQMISPIGILMIVLLAATLSIALNNLIIIGNLSTFSERYQTTSEAFYSPPVWIQVICLGFLTPISEEMVFRGMMYRRMRKDTGFIPSLIYTAFIFALFHVNVVQVIYALMMGLMLAFLCEKYHTVLAPVIAHITANLLSIGATAMNLYDVLMSNIWIAGVVTVACAAAAAFFLLRIHYETGE